MYTIIPFRYVDASNFKQYDEIVLKGELTQAEMDAIGAKLIDEHLFIPADLHLGIPELQNRMDGFPTADDHVFHELKSSHPANRWLGSGCGNSSLRASYALACQCLSAN